MNPSEIPLSQAAGSCPRCGSTSANAFGFEGLCLRCAGVRVLELESGTPWEVEADDKPLERIGPYEIIEELGHGGMGRVFAARQPGLGRIVAVKAIREGINPDLDLRFLREIQTVAGLRHPNIVVVHDSGRSHGSIYFSMDYIEGGDLAARLKVEAMPLKESVLLMSKVADALAYSHAQGILHRDLKPSNILLDGIEPKIADFGLAAQIDAGGDLTAVTHILGTPHYLAPEAIFGGSAAQSVASDIYSVGVILFEMLTGRTPFSGASAAELPALVKESDPPSVRLLAPAVPRDLETLCLKCLDRDPARRYASAADLAGDLRRFLAGQPILARPAGALHRLRSFGRRHRIAVLASALVALTLVGATLVSLGLAARATRAERKAAAESATSKAVVAFLQHDLLFQAAPDAQPDRDIKLRTVLERAAAKVSERFKDQPEAELGIRETLAQTYQSLGDFAAERPQVDRAVELSRQLHGPEDEKTLGDMGEKALLLAKTGQIEDGRKLMTEVVRLENQALGPSALLTLHSTNDLIYIYSLGGNIQGAEALAREVIPRCEEALGPLADETLAAKTDLSSMYFWEGKLREAEVTNLEVMRAFTDKIGPEGPDTLVAMGNLAAVYAAEDKTQEAETMNEKLYAIRKRLLGPEHPDTLRALNNLGTAYREDGKLDLAEETNRLAYEGRLKLLGPDHPETAMAEVNLILAKLEKGRDAEADAQATAGLAVVRKASGPEHFATLGMISALAEIKRREGQLDEAERLRAEVYAARGRRGGPDNYNTLLAANGLAQVEVERGEFTQAETLLRPAVVSWKKVQPGNWRGLVCQSLLGAALAGERRFAEAEPLLVSNAEALEKRRGEIPPLERRVVGEAEERAAAAYGAWGRADKALAWSRRPGGASP